MSEVANIPHLRFPEFSGEWEEVLLYDCLNDIIDFRGRTPLKIGMDWGGGNIISLSANNVKNGYIDFNAECHLGSEELYEKWMGKVKLVKNDIVFTMEAPLGKALLVPDDKRYILSQRVVAFKTKDYIDNLYFIQLIWSNKFQNTVDRLSTGSTAKGINQKSLKKVFVNIPLKLEQQKIAAFLTAVDNKIEQLSKKQELLGEYKKGLMQQIFSQAIRFSPKGTSSQAQGEIDDGSDFAEWEEKKLKELFTYKNGGSFEKDVRDNGVYNLITLNSIDINGELKSIHKTIDYNDGSLNKGDLIMVLSDVAHGNFLGLTAIIPDDDKYVLNQRMGALKPKTNDCIKFIRMFINFNQKYFKLHGQGSSQQNLSKGDIEKFIVNIPTLEEQTKIANFLSSIDNKIEQVGEQLDKSKAFKKALLQQMFV